MRGMEKRAKKEARLLWAPNVVRLVHMAGRSYAIRRIKGRDVVRCLRQPVRAPGKALGEVVPFPVLEV